MPSSHSEPPSQYIERVRRRTSFAAARKIIGFVFWLSIVAVFFISGAAAIGALTIAYRSEDLWSMVPAIGLVLAMIVYVMCIILLRAIAVAYFDGVDVLIEANRNKKEEPNQTPEPTAPSGRGSS